MDLLSSQYEATAELITPSEALSYTVSVTVGVDLP